MAPRALGEVEQLVLIAVLALEGEPYGAAIHREIEARTGRDVAVGSIYNALDRLQTRGAVASRMGPPSPKRGGRRKRLYRLRPDGAAALARSLNLIEAMTAGLEEELARLPGSPGVRS